MEITTPNICILKAFLRDVHALDCNWVENLRAFYITNNRDADDKVIYIYLVWNKAVEAYNKYINELLNINQ